MHEKDSKFELKRRGDGGENRTVGQDGEPQKIKKKFYFF